MITEIRSTAARATLDHHKAMDYADNRCANGLKYLAHVLFQKPSLNALFDSLADQFE